MAEQGPSASVHPIRGEDVVVRLERLSEMPMRRSKWLWSGRIPLGELTLVAGREGIGKSTFLAWLTARITRGELEGELYGERRPIMYAASEDDWYSTIKPRMQAAGVDQSETYKVLMTDVETKQGVRLRLPKHVDQVFVEAERIGCPAIMLDPLISFLPESVDPWKAAEVRPRLEEIREAGAAHGVSVIVLMHFNKSSGTDILTRISGSRAFAEVARAAIGLARLPVEDGEEHAGPFVLSQAKNNLGRMDLPNLTYTIMSAELTADDGKPFETGRFAFVGESDISAEEALNHQPRRRADDGRTAEWVTEMLAWIRGEDRPVAVSEIVDHCAEQKANTVRARLARLAKSGHLHAPIPGHYRVTAEAAE